MGLDTIVSRFDTIGASKGQGWIFISHSLPMMVDHWLTGIGLGSYTLLSPVYLKGFPENLHNRQGAQRIFRTIDRTWNSRCITSFLLAGGRHVETAYSYFGSTIEGVNPR